MVHHGETDPRAKVAYKRLYDAHSTHIHNLPDNVVAALGRYTGTGYSVINHALAAGTDIPDIAKIDSAFEGDGSRLPNSVKLRRGMATNNLLAGLGLVPEDLAGDKVGTLVGRVYTEKVYASTTLDVKRVMHFSQAAKKGKTTLFINAPKGSKALFLGGAASEHGNELEVLLPRDSKMLITSAKRSQSSGGSVVVLTVDLL